MKKIVYILYIISILPLIDFVYTIIKENSIDWLSGINVIAILFAATSLQQQILKKE